MENVTVFSTPVVKSVFSISVGATQGYVVVYDMGRSWSEVVAAVDGSSLSVFFPHNDHPSGGGKGKRLLHPVCGLLQGRKMQNSISDPFLHVWSVSDMGSEHYCLRWNNHQSNLLGVFSQLLRDESLVDVTLACSEGHSIRAHKVVLSACSSYFQTLFVDHPSRHPIVILKDVRFAELRTLIEFMYKGEVNVEYCQLSALLKTAESLKVKGLAEMTNLGQRDQRDYSKQAEEPPEQEEPTELINKQPHQQQQLPQQHSQSTSSSSSSSIHNATVAAAAATVGEELRDRECRDRDNRDRDRDSRDRDREARDGHLRGSPVAGGALCHNAPLMDHYRRSASPPERTRSAGTPNQEDDCRPSDMTLHNNGNTLGSCSTTVGSTPSACIRLPSSSSPPINISDPQPGPSNMLPVQQVPLSLKKEKEVDWGGGGMTDDKSAGESSSEYTRHPHEPDLESRDSGSPQIYPCMYCGASFPHQSKLTRHILSHSFNTIKFTEALNPLELPMRGGPLLTPHEPPIDPTDQPPTTPMDLEHASADGPGVVLCKFCGKSFPDVSSLITHLPVHTGDRPFKCEFCGKAFKLRHHMKDHCRVHTGERPFRCTLCGKTFSRSTILKAHEKTHYPKYVRKFLSPSPLDTEEESPH